MTTPAKSSKTMATLPYSQETGRVIPLDEIDAKPAALKHRLDTFRQLKWQLKCSKASKS